MLERRHKVAGGALCHVDVAGEQGVGEAREQPADEVLVHVGWQPVKLELAASEKIMESNCLILNVSLSTDEMAPGSKEARQGLRIANDHKPGEEGGDGGGLEESARSENLLEEPTQGGQQ